MGRSNEKPKKRRRTEPSNRRIKKKVCQFCRDKVDHIDYKDVSVLRRYMSDRAKIRTRRVTGNCPRHQREVALAIRNARELALMPYLGNR